MVQVLVVRMWRRRVKVILCLSVLFAYRKMSLLYTQPPGQTAPNSVKLGAGILGAGLGQGRSKCQ